MLMQFTLTFKTPDVLEQIEDLDESEKEQAYTFARKFVKYDEHITIEFDTVANTATVLKK